MSTCLSCKHYHAFDVPYLKSLEGKGQCLFWYDLQKLGLWHTNKPKQGFYWPTMYDPEMVKKCDGHQGAEE